MPYKNKEDERRCRKRTLPVWKAKNPDKLRVYEQRYYSKPGVLEHRKHMVKLRSERPGDHEKQAKRRRLYNLKYKSRWVGIVPSFAQCECCGKDVVYLSDDINNRIYFDHRKGGTEAIQGSPRKWLLCHRPTFENIQIWKDCGFGLLCNNCNILLPTENRLLFLEHALAYARKVV